MRANIGHRRAVNVASAGGGGGPSYPQQAPPVHRVEQNERRRKRYSTLLVDPDRDLLGRGGQAAVQLTCRFFRHLELDLAHRLHFHRVRQLCV